MDTLSEHLESLASVGLVESRGAFTLAEGQVWERLQQALPDGRGSLRSLLRWLHARRAQEIRIEYQKPYRLAVRASFADATSLPDLAAGEELALSGTDIDLARAGVAALHLGLDALTVEFDTGARCHQRRLCQGSRWEASPSSGKPEVRLVYEFDKTGWPVVLDWESDIQRRFCYSAVSLRWNKQLFSGPFRLSSPVLVWRHLRRSRDHGCTLVVASPPEAVESYRVTRPHNVEVVLGMRASLAREEGPSFALLRHGELFDLPLARRELAGFCGVICADEHPLDIEGNRPVWNGNLERLVASFKEEAVDMALQLYRHQPPLQASQLEGTFLGLQSVLLQLLDQQRFGEGHILATWMREQVETSPLLTRFREGYTFDRLCSLLAEPAGHPVASIRWAKSAETRMREQSLGNPEATEEALLITARLELRARRDQPIRLTGNTADRLLGLARRREQQLRRKEAAEIYRLLSSAYPTSPEQSQEYAVQAERCEEPAPS